MKDGTVQLAMPFTLSPENILTEERVGIKTTKGGRICVAEKGLG